MSINEQVLQYLCTEYNDEEFDEILKEKWEFWKKVIKILHEHLCVKKETIDKFLKSNIDEFKGNLEYLKTKGTDAATKNDDEVNKQVILGLLDSKVSVSKLSLTYFLAREVGFLGDDMSWYAFEYKRVEPGIPTMPQYAYQVKMEKEEKDKINKKTFDIYSDRDKYIIDDYHLYVKKDGKITKYISEDLAEQKFKEKLSDVNDLMTKNFEELKDNVINNLIQMRILLLRAELEELPEKKDPNAKNVNLVHIKHLEDFYEFYGEEDKWHTKSKKVAESLIGTLSDDEKKNKNLIRKIIYNVPWDYSAIYGGKKNIFSAINNDKYKQVIFTGAPGTGKTYGISRYIDIACLENPIGKPNNNLEFDGDSPEEAKNEEAKKKLMDAYATYELKSGRKAKQKEFVQFHSSYDYSNFVEGLRPYQEETKNPTFIRMDGIFKEFCRNVVEYNLENPNDKKKFYFIIDEINRADLGKVFGELMYGLEESYRGKEHHFDTQYKNLPTYRINSEGKKVQLYTYEDLVTLLKNKKESNIILCSSKDENVTIENDKIKVEGKEINDVDDFVGKTLKIDDVEQQIEVDVFEKGFYIPENVYIIGSMNDIDRSVATIDFAMRRRFKWIEVKANDVMENTLTSIFRKAKLEAASDVVDEEDSEGESENEENQGNDNSSEETNNKAKKLTNQVKDMNRVIFSPNAKKDETSGIYYGLNESYHIGPAYFKSYDGTDKSLKDIWKKKVRPILQEYVRGYGEEKTNKFINECYKELFNPKNKDNDIDEQSEILIDGSVGKYKEIIEQREAKQIVFTGAPGTGKTFGITEAVKEICNDEKRYKFVQFHSSYDYSDFVEGLRPVQMGDDTTFVRMDGVFKEFCRKAEGNLEQDYYFIIDEINRADLGKVFGELMFGLEESYRGKNNTIITQYHNLDSYRIEGNKPVKIENDCFKDGFYIPENVHVIGSMNDIDRSVETFDFALRRRFHWITVEANDVMKEVLCGIAAKDVPDDVIGKIIAMNGYISSAGSKYGLSKSYHIGPAYFKNYISETEEDLKKLFNEDIAPIVREYLRGRAEAELFIGELKNILIKD